MTAVEVDQNAIRALSTDCEEPSRFATRANPSDDATPSIAIKCDPPEEEHNNATLPSIIVSIDETTV
jgi:predicted metalloenzyme YecM